MRFSVRARVLIVEVWMAAVAHGEAVLELQVGFAELRRPSLPAPWMLTMREVGGERGGVEWLLSCDIESSFNPTDHPSTKGPRNWV